MKINEAIRSFREHFAMTQPQFAKKLGLSLFSFSQYEIAERKPDAESMARLCRAAVEVKRFDLADIFAAAIPGVADGLLIPKWRIQPQLEVGPKARTRTAILATTLEAVKTPPLLKSGSVRPRQSDGLSKEFFLAVRPTKTDCKVST